MFRATDRIKTRRKLSRCCDRSSYFIQVSWSLTQGCRSVETTNHRDRQLPCASVSTSLTDVPSTDPADGHSITVGLREPLPLPCQLYAVAAPANRSGSDEINDSNHNSGSDSQPTVGIGASTVVDCTINGDDVDPVNVARSSWELRQHFPVDALVPRASPTRMFTGPSTLAKTTFAQNDSPARIPATSTTASNTFPAQVSPATERRKPESAKSNTQRKPSDSETPATETDAGRTPKRLCARIHTASTRVQDMDPAWAGRMSGGFKHTANAKDTTSENRARFSAVSGGVSVNFSPGAAAVNDNESRVAKIQQGDNGLVECSSPKSPPRWKQPRWGAPGGGQAKAGAVVGLTAEVLKSPGVALHRSGRVVTVEKVK